MKQTIKLLGMFLAGAVVGIIFASIVAKKTVYRAWQDEFVISRMDRAHIALLLRAGMTNTVSRWLEPELPQYAKSIDQDFRGSSQSTNALWMIKAFYQFSSIPVPPGIVPILAALPEQPPPVCQVQLKEFIQLKESNKP